MVSLGSWWPTLLLLVTCYFFLLFHFRKEGSKNYESPSPAVSHFIYLRDSIHKSNFRKVKLKVYKIKWITLSLKTVNFFPTFFFLNILWKTKTCTNAHRWRKGTLKGELTRLLEGRLPGILSKGFLPLMGPTCPACPCVGKGWEERSLLGATSQCEGHMQELIWSKRRMETSNRGAYLMLYLRGNHGRKEKNVYFPAPHLP